MISFTALNIMIGATAGIAAGVMMSFYSKKSALMIGATLAMFAMGFGLSQAFLGPLYEVWYLESEMDQVPIMSVIEKYHPNEYKQLMKIAKESVKKDEKSQNLIAYAYVFANQIFMSDLKNAPDQAIFEYLNAIRRMYGFLLHANPQFIIKLESADLSATFDLTYLLTDPDFKKSFDTTIRTKMNIIKEAVKHPVQAGNEIEANALLNGVLNELKSKYGAEDVNLALNVSGQQLDPKREAEIIVNFYQQIINLNPARAGTVMRYIGLLSTKQSSPG